MRNEARAAMRAGGAEPVLAAEGFDLPEEEEKKEFKFKSVFTGEKIKNGFRKIGVRNLVIVLAVLLIGGAVYANWRLFGQTAKPSGDTTVVDNNQGDDNTATAASYFSASQVERQRARDEAIEVLQSVVDNASEADAAAKEEAMQGISAIASSIEREANIE
ncbi:MAG: SpoIIIAH-like family protein, partial [Clostridia bacterium]|nr:SpoIIIAH-like family protein [Clostridia bacterium]